MFIFAYWERATSVRVGVAPLQWGFRVQYVNPLRLIGSICGPIVRGPYVDGSSALQRAIIGT